MTFKIKPIVSERQCIKCMQCKLVTEFPTDRNTCKECRRAQALQWYHVRGATRQAATKRQPQSPTAWLLPCDPRSFRQQLLAATQRNWRYPVTPSPMFGVPMVGVVS